MRLQVIIYHLQSTLQIFHCWIWLGVFLLMCNVSAIKSRSREETAWNFGVREQTARIIFSDLYLCCDFVCLFSSKLNTKTVKKQNKTTQKTLNAICNWIFYRENMRPDYNSSSIWFMALQTAKVHVYIVYFRRSRALPPKAWMPELWNHSIKWKVFC